MRSVAIAALLLVAASAGAQAPDTMPAAAPATPIAGPSAPPDAGRTVSRRASLAPLEAARHAALDARMNGFHAAYRSHALDERSLSREFGAFARTDHHFEDEPTPGCVTSPAPTPRTSRVASTT